MKYQVIDRKTGQNVGKPYSNKKRAKSRAEKLDLDYGAYRYGVKEIEENA